MMFSANKTTPEFLLEIAQREKELRKHLKLSQRELAERSGVSLGSLKRFESSGQVSLESLIKIAQILDATDALNHLFPPQKDLSKVENLFSNKTR